LTSADALSACSWVHARGCLYVRARLSESLEDQSDGCSSEMIQRLAQVVRSFRGGQAWRSGAVV